jgi:hypothetical protein
LKLLWLHLEKKKEIIETISASFFGDQSKRLNVGLNIYLMLLKNLQLSNYSLGYAKYRTIINSFQNEVLLSLFVNTKQVLLIYMQQIYQGDLSAVRSNDLEVALEVMHHIITYPFSICYLEFTAEGNFDVNTVTMFPESWKPFLIDLPYCEGLLRLLSLPDLSSDISLMVVKILSKLVSCKKTMVPNELEASNTYLAYLLELPGSIASRVNLKELVYLEELVDLIERSITVYGLIKLLDFGQRSENWVGTILNITKIVIARGYKVDSS